MKTMAPLVAPLLAAALGCASGASRPTSAPPPATQPFGGKPHAIPGVIEAESYDEGPPGVAYQDVDAKNQGDTAFRPDTQVDIEPRPDASGGRGVGWTRAGEWLVYTVEVAAPAKYTLEVPVASNKKGGTFHIEIDGQDRTGRIEVPDTGGWQILSTITRPGIELAAGRQTMRVVMDSDGESKSVADIDLFRFRRE